MMKELFKISKKSLRESKTDTQNLASNLCEVLFRPLPKNNKLKQAVFTINSTKFKIKEKSI